MYGKIYIICIYVDEENVINEFWINFLFELSVCIDGVVVDFINFIVVDVWFGNVKNIKY